MTRLVRTILPLALLACAGSSSSDDDDDTTTDTDGDDLLSLTIPPVGDFSGFEPADDYASAQWLTQTVDPAKVGDITLDGTVEDFQTDDPKARTEVRLWYDDVPEGPPDATGAADDDGKVTLTGRSCAPLSYLALRDPALDDAKPTYKSHQVYAPSDGGDVVAEFVNVSVDSFLLIPTLVNISPDPAKSIVAGTAFDVTRAPEIDSDIDDGKVEGVQVVVRDLQGNVPEGVKTIYYFDSFPTRDQKHTSADGLWTIVDVPPGDWRVEMWGLMDGEPKLLGATSLKSFADSINIANIFAGYDAVKYPSDCLADPGDTDDTDVDTDTDSM